MVLLLWLLPLLRVSLIANIRFRCCYSVYQSVTDYQFVSSFAMTDRVANHLLQSIPEEASYNSNSTTFDQSQDSIGSLDGTHFWSISLEDTPILPAIDGKRVKTFDELVEEALKRDDSPANLDFTEKPKKPFLRKGSGLVRFAPKLDTPKRERRYCCRKKLEQQFSDEAVKCNEHIDRKSSKSGQVKSNHVENNSRKKFLVKGVSQSIKRNVAELNGISIQPKKIQTNSILHKRPASGKSLSNVILSRYSTEIEPIHRENTNHVISHEFVPKENSSRRRSNFLPNDKKGDYENEEPRVEVLERLLKSIKEKQQELQQRANEYHSEDESWEDEQEEPRMSLKVPKNKNSTKSKTHKKVTRTGTFTLGKSDLNKESNSDLLSTPQVSNYTLSLKRKIETLEDRLRELTVKCQQNISDYKSRESPTVDKVSSEKIFSEMNEIKKHLSSLTNKLDTIETKLLTKESPTSGIKLNLPSSSAKVLASPAASLHSQIKQLQTGTHLTLDNGDQIMKTSDNTIIYSYASGVRQITYFDGTRVVEFPSGQIERVSANGTKTVFYSNGTQRVIRADGSEETITPDGTIIRITVDGTEIIELSNGEREIRTRQFRRREYADGTVKTVYADGTEETRFPTGRLRIKDRDGKLIADSLLTQFRGIA